MFEIQRCPVCHAREWEAITEGDYRWRCTNCLALARINGGYIGIWMPPSDDPPDFLEQVPDTSSGEPK